VCCSIIIIVVALHIKKRNWVKAQLTKSLGNSLYFLLLYLSVPIAIRRISKCSMSFYRKLFNRLTFDQQTFG
jgi:hypothetical protein